MQTLDTINWVGDGDDTDFFVAIERTFDLRLRSNLPWTTFGEVRDHVVAHVAAHGGGGTTCATQMTFYRLRRALRLGRQSGRTRLWHHWSVRTCVLRSANWKLIPT